VRGLKFSRCENLGHFSVTSSLDYFKEKGEVALPENIRGDVKK